MKTNVGNLKNKNNGITLITLVITIIVLLILAGISISMLSGENGILTKVADASTLTEISRIRRSSQFNLLEKYI